MNTPSNRNKPYYPTMFDQSKSYEGIGTADCTSFGYYTEKGKLAYEAEQSFRRLHPEIRNVTAANDLHSWLNNSSCTVDACYPLLSKFAETYNCPLSELLNLVQRCIIQSTVESAHRMYHVVQTHQLFDEGAYDLSKKITKEPFIPPPIWNNASLMKRSEQKEEEKEEKEKEKKNDTKTKEDESKKLVQFTPDELFLNTSCKIPPFNEMTVLGLQKLCSKLGIKKYSSMNKEAMVNLLEVYKKKYNTCSMFRFQHFYKQEQCNAPVCKCTKKLLSVNSLKWKYCEKHVSATEMLSEWDLKVNSTFFDIQQNVRITREQSILKFEDKDFDDIMKESVSVKEKTVPFKNNNSQLNNRLVSEKVKKSKSSASSLRQKILKQKLTRNVGGPKMQNDYLVNDFSSSFDDQNTTTGDMEMESEQFENEPEEELEKEDCEDIEEEEQEEEEEEEQEEEEEEEQEEEDKDDYMSDDESIPKKRKRN